MRLTLGGLLLWGALAAVAACSSSVIPGPPGDSGEPDAGTDAGGPADASMTPFDAQASVVFVDGLVNGDATDTANASLTLDDVRVCVLDALTKQPITKYALPDSTPMPLTNYPGVHRGGGVDLGSFQKLDVIIDVYSAADLLTDATWSANRSAFTCTTMGCDQGPPCQHHVRLPATLQAGVNVIALVDDSSAAGVTLAERSFADVTFAGTAGSLWGTVVDFSGWHSTLAVGAFYGNYVDGSGTVNSAIVDPIDPQAPASPKQITPKIASGDYDGLGIRFDAYSGGQPSDRFGQSLDSIAFVSDATLTPPELYGVRENFVFALVGDPNDPLSVQKNGGRDPAFNGRGLHIVAVPYATPLPQH